jgi:predicted secreted hydrolase
MAFVVSALAFFGGVFSVRADDFARATPGYSWAFPSDHGYHNSYETEWWYYTGQLYEESAQAFSSAPVFGFQLTFFRKGIRSSDGVQSEYMAHAAVTDVRANKTYFSSRVGGGELGIAGVNAHSLQAWSGDWSVDPNDKTLSLRFSVGAEGTNSPHSLHVIVESLPEPWLQGQNGFSAKASCQGCASHYYSLPRLQLTASYSQGPKRRDLKGIGWMDHEFMTNALASKQVGWDWMGLMLRDGRSLTLFQLREASGRIDFASGGILQGQTARALQRGDFTLTPLQTWSSPRTKAQYPTEWRVIVPSEQIDAVISARVSDSEIGATQNSGGGPATETIVYWEGPVASRGEDIVGYLEMTGYAAAVALGGERR